MSPDSSGRIVLSWDQVVSLSEELARLAQAETFDIVLAVARGGLIPAALIAQILNLRAMEMVSTVGYTGENRDETFQIRSFPADSALRGKRVLVVDDVWDTGRTAVAVRKRVAAVGGIPIVAVLHFKPGASLYPGDAPELFVDRTDDWIVYPWERTR